jgi:hypothetical protein
MSRTPEQVLWDFVESWLQKAETDLKASAVTLTPFGAELRYPGEVVGRLEAKSAYSEADKVRAAVLARLKDYLSQGRP